MITPDHFPPITDPEDAKRSPAAAFLSGLVHASEPIAAEIGLAEQPRERIDQLYCDINGERARTTDLGFAMLRVGELFRDATGYVTSVGQVGDLGAATAPLGCILAARAWARGYAPGPTALVSGSSWSGLRGAALLSKGA